MGGEEGSGEVDSDEEKTRWDSESESESESDVTEGKSSDFGAEGDDYR